MIETLILGFLLGMICTGAGAAYAAHKFLKQPYTIKDLGKGFEIGAIGIGFDKDPNGYIGLKKDGKIIAGIKYDEKGITDIVYDI